VVGFIREAIDRVFRTTGQVETALNAPCVALVPLVNDASTAGSLVLPPVGSKAIARDGGVCWVVAEQSLSRFAEAIRSVKLAANTSPLRIVFVRSQAAQERLRAALAPANVEKTIAAPVTAILGYDLKFYEPLPRLFPHADARAWFAGREAFANDMAYKNGTLQAAYFILALRSLGLDTGPMTGFDPTQIDAEFFAGESIRSNILVNIGDGDPAKLFPRSPRFSFDEIARIV
jgi:3-hydroxypropanoate dehydrogenase